MNYQNNKTETSVIQLALKRAGFLDGEIDGVFGSDTRNAVIAFQKSASLSPDGIVGPKTYAALLPYLKGYTIHRVKKGDSLYSIASVHNTSIRKIMLANPTADPLNLQIGTNLTVPFAFSVVPTDVPYTYTLLTYICEGLLMRYPFLSGGVIGKSVMGKSIPYLRIGQGKDEVFYNASHHANEWITTPLLLKFLEEYSESFANGGSLYGTLAAQLFKKATLYIVPMVNPDGVDLVNGVLRNDRYKNETLKISARYPDIPYPNGWKANIAGVDLNLQYPAGWDEAKKIKYSLGFTSPAPRDFVGTAPLSAPESEAVFNFTMKHNFALTLSYHSQGEIIYWKYLDFEPQKSREIAEYFGQISGYAVEETPYNSGFAGYKDWFIQYYDRPGYTIEVGLGQNPLPLTQFDKIYSDNAGILKGGITEI